MRLPWRLMSSHEKLKRAGKRLAVGAGFGAVFAISICVADLPAEAGIWISDAVEAEFSHMPTRPTPSGSQSRDGPNRNRLNGEAAYARGRQLERDDLSSNRHLLLSMVSAQTSSAFVGEGKTGVHFSGSCSRRLIPPGLPIQRLIVHRKLIMSLLFEGGLSLMRGSAE